MLTSFDGLLWLIATLVILLILQRSLQREIQVVFLIITRHPNSTIWIYSALFFPGVLLHELSHFIMAWILRVRTGKFSLLPQEMPDGRLQLGYVEAASTDIFRDSLIGVAPLITGMILISVIAVNQLHLNNLWDAFRTSQWDLFLSGLQKMPEAPDFWIWFYCAFIISATMMPSESDRHAWLPLGLVSIVLIGIVILAGAGPWMLANLAPPFNEFLRATSLILLVSILVHLFMLLPVLLFHRLLTRMTGLDVN